MKDSQKILILVALIALVLALKGGMKVVSLSFFQPGALTIILIIIAGIWLMRSGKCGRDC